MSKVKPTAGTFRGDGIFSRPNLYIRRNKAACIAAAVSAPLLVALTGLICVWIASVLPLNDSVFSRRSGHPEMEAIGSGAAIAIFASVLNFYFIPVTVPVTWIILSQSIGRLAHRGISSKWSYLRWSAFWGALLVGATCALPVFLGVMGDLSSDTPSSAPERSELILFFLGSTITGGLVGAVSGTVAGGFFIAIVRPSTQLNNADKQAIEAF